MQLGFPWPNAQSYSPRKEISKIPSCDPKFQRKNENQCVLKSLKKCKTQTLERGFSMKKKSNPSLPSLYILVVAKIKAIVPLQAWERHYKGKMAKFGEFE